MTDLLWVFEAWDMVGENISYEEATGFVLMAMAASAMLTIYGYLLVGLLAKAMRRTT